MRAWYICKYLVPLMFLLHFPMYLSGTGKPPTAGPYRSTVQSVKTCDNPTRPYMKDPPMMFTPLVYNTSSTYYLNGNITITRNTTNVKYRMKSLIWENNRWKVNYMMNNIGCHGVVLYLLCSAVNIKFDRKNCMFLQGSYYFKNLDANAMQHLWASKMEYGKILWKSEVFKPQLGTFFCHEFITVTEPAEAHS